jgi:signal transduction histidine kinase
METNSALGLIADLGARSLATSEEAIDAVAELVRRATGVDFAIVSEVTDDGRYVFRGVDKRADLPIQRGGAIPYERSLCYSAHVGDSPASVPDTREAPALWHQWLHLKAGLDADWDILAFCTREIRLPDGTRFGTLCLHQLEPRSFSADEEALLEVLARLLGQELWRERSAIELSAALGALEDAERRRVELVEELRHELRAPLQVIEGYAEAMLDGVVVRDDEHVTLVRHEAGRAVKLLDDLTELARLEAPPTEVAASVVAADDVVRDMRDRLAPLAEAAAVELVAEVVPAQLRVERKRLEQYLVNLVRNALRAVQSASGSRITIFVRCEDDVVAIGVEDDGPGVAEHELPRVFERFYRGSSGREAATGSGLGLTIARRIVEAAGGRVAAEPIEPHGVRIVARMPAVDQAAAGRLHRPVEA